MNRSLGDNILVIPNEVDLLPNIAEETIHLFLTQVVCSIEPIGSKNTNLKMRSATGLIFVQGVDEGGSIVPFQIVEKLAQLFSYDVEVSTLDPVVP